MNEPTAKRNSKKDQHNSQHTKLEDFIKKKGSRMARIKQN